MQNYTNTNTKPISIPIKESFTTNKREYLVYSDWTFQQLEKALCPQISGDFNIERGMFRLIPYGQDHSEYGQDISRFEGMQLREYWDNILDIGFYLKRL